MLNVLGRDDELMQFPKNAGTSKINVTIDNSPPLTNLSKKKMHIQRLINNTVVLLRFLWYYEA